MAVYKKNYGLDEDGDVGANPLNERPDSPVVAADENSSSRETGFKYGAYQESDAVKQAQAMLNQQLSQKPGAYQSAWQTQLNDTINKILNREKFSYDLNGDALYQQYKDQYVQQGKMAMMDTMGQAQAMTGGYGNSYAQSVGQQAYQGHLQQLNDKIPDLYQLALNKYHMEGDALTDQAALLAQQENLDYGRYRDRLSDYNVEMDRLQNRYDTERDYDYGKWADGRDYAYGQYIDNRNYQYQQDRDKIADEQWQKQFDEALRQWNHANGISNGDDSGGSSGGSSSGSSSGSKGSIGGYDAKTAETQTMLNNSGYNITVDGIWGPETQAAYEDYLKKHNEGGKKTPEKNYDTVVRDMNTLISMGEDMEVINIALSTALKDGLINQGQYQSLKNKFAPDGLA